MSKVANCVSFKSVYQNCIQFPLNFSILLHIKLIIQLLDIPEVQDKKTMTQVHLLNYLLYTVHKHLIYPSLALTCYMLMP